MAADEGTSCPCWQMREEIKAGQCDAISSVDPVAWITRDKKLEHKRDLWFINPPVISFDGIYRGDEYCDQMPMPDEWVIRLLGRDLQPGGIFEVLRIVGRETKQESQGNG